MKKFLLLTSLTLCLFVSNSIAAPTSDTDKEQIREQLGKAQPVREQPVTEQTLSEPPLTDQASREEILTDQPLNEQAPREEAYRDQPLAEQTSKELTSKEQPAKGHSKEQPAKEQLEKKTPVVSKRVEISPLERLLNQNPLSAENVKPQPETFGGVTQFGYSFFRTTGFAPQGDIPVGPDYQIGVGDQLEVTVWGGMDGTFRPVVNRSGEIVVPKVGPIKVMGHRFDEVPALVTAAIGRFYKNFHVSVTMGRLRSIKVYIVGEVNAPGDYNLTSLSTVINALSAAGGPTKNGSLRSIQINRNGKTFAVVDLYDFFIKGDKGKDIRLQAGDTILVPVIGPVAGVAGNVRRPGIYELKDERTLKDLLAFADGVNPTGYLQRVQLFRIDAHQRRAVTDFNLAPKGDKSIDEAAEKIAIKDLDVVKVLPIDSVLRGYVRLTGHVLRPGDYAVKPGIKVSDLLKGDNLLPEYYGKAAQVVRLAPPDQHRELLVFDLTRALQGDPASDLELKEFDRIVVFSKQEMQETPTVSVAGEVQRPGRYRYFENMTVRDLLMQGHNAKLTGYLKDAELVRLQRNGKEVTTETLSIDLEKAMQGGPDNIKLQPFDELTVRQIPNWIEKADRSVTLNGEFVFPGSYPIRKGERLSAVIQRAGGFTSYAYLKGLKFTRASVQRLQQQRMDEALQKAQQDIVNIQTKMAQSATTAEDAAGAKATLETLMQSVEMLKKKKAEGRMLVKLTSLDELKGSVYDVELQGGDTLTVPSDPGGVNVIGDVFNQNTVVTQEGKNVGWYLSQVGGPTKDADVSQIYVVKADGTVVSKNNSPSFLFFNSFSRQPLDSGDTVIVPHDYDKIPWMKEIKDIAGIIGNIAMTVGVLVAAGLKF